MNIDHDALPWNTPELSAYYAYPVAPASMLGIGIGLVVYSRWKKWL